jgi:PleD family two-component response regulator
VLPGTNLEGAMYAAEKLLHKVETAQILASLGYSGSVTVSIGVSEYRRGNHFDTLVSEANQALFICKRSSKNCAQSVQTWWRWRLVESRLGTSKLNRPRPGFLRVKEK